MNFKIKRKEHSVDFYLKLLWLRIFNVVLFKLIRLVTILTDLRVINFVEIMSHG